MSGFATARVIASRDFHDARSLSGVLLELLEIAETLERFAICYVDTPEASFGTGAARLIERTLTDDSVTYDIVLAERAA